MHLPKTPEKLILAFFGLFPILLVVLQPAKALFPNENAIHHRGEDGSGISCPAVRLDRVEPGFKLPKTKANNVVQVPCPFGWRGTTVWHCGSDKRTRDLWIRGLGGDYTNCSSPLGNVDETLSRIQNASIKDPAMVLREIRARLFSDDKSTSTPLLPPSAILELGTMLLQRTREHKYVYSGFSLPSPQHKGGGQGTRDDHDHGLKQFGISTGSDGSPGVAGTTGTTDGYNITDSDYGSWQPNTDGPDYHTEGFDSAHDVAGASSSSGPGASFNGPFDQDVDEFLLKRNQLFTETKKGFLEEVTYLSSDMLSNPISWQLVPLEGGKRRPAATDVQVAVETAALDLADAIKKDSSAESIHRVTAEFVDVTVEKLDYSGVIQQKEKPSEDLVYVYEQSELRIPIRWLAEQMPPWINITSVAFFGFKNFHEVLSPEDVTLNAGRPYSGSGEGDPCTWDDDEAQEVFDDSENRRTAKKLNSIVIGASMAAPSYEYYSDYSNFDPMTSTPSEEDATRVEIQDGPRIKFKTLKGVHSIDQNVRVHCLYWNNELNDWSNDGCRVENRTETEVHCICNHLTNFAVLMDIEGALQSKRQGLLSTIIEVITILGSTLSIICLLVTAAVFTCVPSLRSQTVSIHRNLCLSLAIAKIALLCGLDLTFNRSLCTVTAIILHYLFLVAFSWMLVEGVHIYVMVTQVFESKKIMSRFYYLFAYGTPAIIVSISALTRTAYGNKCYCWLAPGLTSALFFLGPLAAMLATNFCVLVIAVRTATSKSAITMASSKRVEAKSLAKGAMSLTFLLGLTWIFGFFIIGSASAVFAVIFTILNSLQGVFIFAFYVVMNHRTRKETLGRMRRQYHSFIASGVYFLSSTRRTLASSSETKLSGSTAGSGSYVASTDQVGAPNVVSISFVRIADAGGQRRVRDSGFQMRGEQAIHKAKVSD